MAKPKVDPTVGDDRGNDGSGHRDEAGLGGGPIPGVPGLEAARERHQAGDLREALGLYRRIAAAQPDCVDALLPAATIELRLGDAARALELVEAAIALRPESAEPYIVRAEVLQALGRLDDAATSCGRALEIDPDFAGAYDMLGTARPSGVSLFSSPCTKSSRIGPRPASTRPRLSHSARSSLPMVDRTCPFTIS